MVAVLSLVAAEARAQVDGGGGVGDASVDVTDVTVSQGDASVAGDASELDPLDRDPTSEEERAAAHVLPDDEEEPATGADEGAREGDPVPDVPRVAVEVAALTNRACLRALSRAAVPFIRVRQGVPGVALPVMVTGPIRGVRVRGSGVPAERELMDCRLAVALARFAPMLRAMRVRELRHISLFRPASPAEVARRPVQTRHPAGLAIDVAALVFDDGRSVDVLRDFRGRRGAPVCGPGARVRGGAGARALRTVACDAARRGYFNVVLTPNFNRAHRNHLHLEVARDVSWIFVR